MTISIAVKTKRAFAPKLRSKMLKKWNKLTETDIDAIAGSFKLLSEKIQELYIYPPGLAEQECLNFRNANKY